MSKKKAPPKKKTKAQLEATVRFFMIRVGSVALSPSRICDMMKRMAIRPKPMKRPIMRELFQGYLLPPHWRARRRQTTAGRRRANPMRSSSVIFFRRDFPDFACGRCRKI